jgi:hypothetical protein
VFKNMSGQEGGGDPGIIPPLRNLPRVTEFDAIFCVQCTVYPVGGGG